MQIRCMSCIKISPNLYPQVHLLNCVWIFTLYPQNFTLPPTPPFPQCLSFQMVQYAFGPLSKTPHLPMSLAAKSPSRDLFKWNIWFYFEVPKLVNHLERKDAARVVKLLCLAAGSPCADRELKGMREVSSGTSSPEFDVVGACHCWLLCCYCRWRPNGMLGYEISEKGAFPSRLPSEQ